MARAVSRGPVGSGGVLDKRFGRVYGGRATGGGCDRSGGSGDQIEGDVTGGENFDSKKTSKENDIGHIGLNNNYNKNEIIHYKLNTLDRRGGGRGGQRRRRNRRVNYKESVSVVRRPLNLKTADPGEGVASISSQSSGQDRCQTGTEFRVPTAVSCRPPPDSLVQALPGHPAQSLFTRRPPETGRSCQWRPAKTVDYEGVWAPGVVTEYGGQVGKEEGGFQPRLYDYGHGGEDGDIGVVDKGEKGKLVSDEEMKQVEVKSEQEKQVENKSEEPVEKKGYSRRRLVGFF